MAKTSFKMLALLGGLAVGIAAPAIAQDSGPLIDKLVKKGILTDQEGEDLRADLQKDFGTSSAGKLNVSSALTELKISGDMRARFEARSGENGTVSGASVANSAGTVGDQLTRDRFRYRLRLGLTGKMQDGWFFGTRIEPTGNNRSTNITSGNTNAQGGNTPFNKSDTLSLGQAYIGRNVGDLTVIAGKQPMPLVTTSMLWDDDINPEGLTEQWSTTASGVTWMVNAGQFVYEGSGTTNNFGSAHRSQNTFLWATQAGGKAEVVKGPEQWCYRSERIDRAEQRLPPDHRFVDCRHSS